MPVTLTKRGYVEKNGITSSDYSYVCAVEWLEKCLYHSVSVKVGFCKGRLAIIKKPVQLELPGDLGSSLLAFSISM